MCLSSGCRRLLVARPGMCGATLSLIRNDMPIVCPTITAEDEKGYKQQMHKVASFAHRVQIDLTDGIFAEHKTLPPKEVWWPVGIKADFHLMYQEPLLAAKEILKHKPHLINVHAEAGG